MFTAIYLGFRSEGSNCTLNFKGSGYSMGSFDCSRSFGQTPHCRLPFLSIVHDTILVSSFVEVVSCLTATDLP